MIMNARSPPASAHASAAFIYYINGLYCRTAMLPGTHCNPGCCQPPNNDGTLYPYNTVPTTWDMTQLFLQNVFCYHGLTTGIVSDWGSQFIS